MQDQPRCYDHKTSETLPTLCPTCQRIKVEQRIVKKTVAALIKAGYSLNVNNGGDREELPEPSRDAQVILAEMMETDDEYLMVYQPPSVDGSVARPRWIRFVYGNDGWDVISDYHTGLDDILEPITDWCQTLDPRQ